MDRREEILDDEYRKWVDEKGIAAIYPPNFPKAYEDAAKNAMDENFRVRAMELLEWMANQSVDCRIDDNDKPIFMVGPILRMKELTAEQLFNNFL